MSMLKLLELVASLLLRMLSPYITWAMSFFSSPLRWELFVGMVIYLFCHNVKSEAYSISQFVVKSLEPTVLLFFGDK